MMIFVKPQHFSLIEYSNTVFMVSPMTIGYFQINSNQTESYYILNQICNKKEVVG